MPDSLREIGDAPLVVTVGNALCYENVEQFVDAVRRKLSDGHRALVLDLGKVEMVDSSGLRALLRIRKSCEDAGVQFRLGSVSDCVARILTISRLNELFGVEERAWGPRPIGPLPTLDLSSEHRRIHEYRATSDPAVIAGLREKAVVAAVEAGAAGDLLCDIQIAIGEALTNAYKHGSPKKGIDEIQLRCVSCPGAIVFEVQDEGHPFDPDGPGEPDPRRMNDHGMGIYLMRQAMDVVEFACDCPGNRVRMVKWLGDSG